MNYKAIKKTIYTVCTPDYDKEISSITLPLMKAYASKINADFSLIESRKFPDWPAGCEKFQIYRLGQEAQNDWNIYIDADALVHPDMIDLTAILHKDTILTFAYDQGLVRWKPDRYFLRDGRYIGPGNWFTIASDWCIDLWKMPELSCKEVESRITPTIAEKRSGVIDSNHLIDDYIVGRNIAKYSFKYTSAKMLFESIKRPELSALLWHQYAIPSEVKIQGMQKILREWGLV